MPRYLHVESNFTAKLKPLRPSWGQQVVVRRGKRADKHQELQALAKIYFMPV
jgi:hypothetical protein